jgi:hypothetical protein
LLAVWHRRMVSSERLAAFIRAATLVTR